MNRCTKCGRLTGAKEHACKPAWNKGKKGCYTLSAETKKKISEAGLGRKHSDKTKEKIRLSNIGNTNNLGKKHSVETRRKISASNMGKVISKESIEKTRAKLIGRKLSEEQRAKRRGEFASNWKGGISRLNFRIRASAEYTEWRKQVFYRDKFTCVLCGKKGDVNADHIKAFSILLKEFKIEKPTDAIDCVGLWDINNGRTLCVPCHKKTDNFAGRTRP